jgi:hypothetical protein
VLNLLLYMTTHLGYSSDVVQGGRDKVDSRNICQWWTLGMELPFY